MFVGAGDPSGDLLSAALLRAARPLLPPLDAWGYGGDRLAREGVRLVAGLSSFATSGLAEATTRLGSNLALLASVQEAFARRPPHLGVLVDYPDLHFVVGPALTRAGARVLYLLPPQVWAWRGHRARLMRSFVDAVAVSLPFEQAIYEREGIRASFIGHPLGLLEAYRNRPPGRAAGRPVVALLPGSRTHEVRGLLPVMLAAADAAAGRSGGLRLRVGISPAVDERLYDRLIEQSGVSDVERLRDDGDVHATVASRTLWGASAALVHAGTATLEAGLLAVPSVVTARLHPLTWEVARRVVRVDHVALPSIVLGRRLFVERLQHEVTASVLARDLTTLLADAEPSRRVREGAGELRALVLRSDTAERFATLLAPLLHEASSGRRGRVDGDPAA